MFILKLLNYAFFCQEEFAQLCQVQSPLNHRKAIIKRLMMLLMITHGDHHHLLEIGKCLQLAENLELRINLNDDDDRCAKPLFHSRKVSLIRIRLIREAMHYQFRL